MGYRVTHKRCPMDDFGIGSGDDHVQVQRGPTDDEPPYYIFSDEFGAAREALMYLAEGGQEVMHITDGGGGFAAEVREGRIQVQEGYFGLFEFDLQDLDIWWVQIGHTMVFSLETLQGRLGVLIRKPPEIVDSSLVDDDDWDASLDKI